MIDVFRSLDGEAKAFLARHQLVLSPTGRLYLSWLLFRGASVIEREGKSSDQDAIGLARKNLETLLATAGGISLAGGEGLHGFFAGVARGGIRGRISAADLRDALRRLPPIWPFTRRRNAARAV